MDGWRCCSGTTTMTTSPVRFAQVQVSLTGLSGVARRLTVWRVDGTHADAYAAWQAMGSPQSPDETQYAALQTAARLTPAEAPRALAVAGGQAVISLRLPRQGLALLELAPPTASSASSDRNPAHGLAQDPPGPRRSAATISAER